MCRQWTGSIHRGRLRHHRFTRGGGDTTRLATRATGFVPDRLHSRHLAVFDHPNRRSRREYITNKEKRSSLVARAPAYIRVSDTYSALGVRRVRASEVERNNAILIRIHLSRRNVSWYKYTTTTAMDRHQLSPKFHTTFVNARCSRFGIFSRTAKGPARNRYRVIPYLRKSLLLDH